MNQRHGGEGGKEEPRRVCGGIEKQRRQMQMRKRR